MLAVDGTNTPSFSQHLDRDAKHRTPIGCQHAALISFLLPVVEDDIPPFFFELFPTIIVTN